MNARFAAKEAAIKAHSHAHGRLSFHDVLIRTLPPAGAAGAHGRRQDESGETSPSSPSARGPPVAVLKGAGSDSPGLEAALSISHDGDYASAVCLARY